MLRSLRWKWFSIAASILVCLAAITGLPKSVIELKENLSRNIRLGLDLKGGSHMVLQVQIQDAFKVEADQVIDQLKQALDREQIGYASIERNDPDAIETADRITITVRNIPSARQNDFVRLAKEVTQGAWSVNGQSSGDYSLTIAPQTATALRQETLTQTIETLERKVNALGVAEASVQRRGGADSQADVRVQLPGVDDPTRVKNILQTAAMLELVQVRSGPYESREAALAENGGILPLNSRLVQGANRSASGPTWWLLARSPAVTGRDIRDARAQSSEGGTGWDTNFVLSQETAARFERFTAANIGSRLAIVLDGRVLSAPRIENKISNQGRIVGAANHEEAGDLALNLRAGALPAGIKVIEERVVGPSLGADSIRKGITASLVGLGLVVASMILYYRGAGLNAVLALLLNTLITIAALSYIEAAWTLPGIAGLVLSIGMAVDSNVLIFERIKEELAEERGIPQAIHSGFRRAFVTILDTHVTTVVASLFLFLFGTGPVRGFAVTLVVGLIANLFTAVFVSRAVFDWQLLRNPKLRKLSIWPTQHGELFRLPNIAFLDKRRLTLGVSALMVIGSMALLVIKGIRYGLDFRGGTLTYVKFAAKPSIDELRGVISSHIPGEISVQELKDGNEFIIGSELADEHQLERTRLDIQNTLQAKYGRLGSKLDLNNAGHSQLVERLQSSPKAGSVPLTGDQWNEVARRILDYRDHEKRGILSSYDELLRLDGMNSQILEVVKAEAGMSGFNILSVEMVGPRAGEQLRRQALLATTCALGGMLAYIAFRFQLIAGVAAVIATVHDVVITLGLFSLLDRDINLNIIAALLTLIGYSMNDKIVVFDRVRENESAQRSKTNFIDLVNRSINQTLSRTLLTAGPTLLACLALYFLGGEVLNGIAFTLLAGIVIGTYSSIFIASALLVVWRQHKSGSTGSSVQANCTAATPQGV